MCQNAVYILKPRFSITKIVSRFFLQVLVLNPKNFEGVLKKNIWIKYSTEI